MSENSSEQLSLILETSVAPINSKTMSAKELYLRADEEMLSNIKESICFERKSSKMQPKDLAEYFSMFSNTQPDGGVLCIGIEKDGTKTGCSNLSDTQLNELEQTAYVHCPASRYERKRVPITNHIGNPDFVLLFHIQSDDQKVVETTKGTACIRVGDSKKRLSAEEKLELKYAKGEIELERQPCNLPYPSEFDMRAIDSYCVAYRTKRGHTMPASREDILELSRLGKRIPGGFTPNIACALLFAKDPQASIPGGRIRFLRFEGEKEGTGEKFNAIKDIIIEGQIPNQIVEAEKTLDSQMRNFTRLGKDGKFFTAPEYPKPAWYEAIVNACVHRSYGLRNMNIFVKMFDDRLEIESPGGFPPLVTPQNIYDMHQPRNPHLMNAMYYLDYVKCAHEGTRRIRETMHEMKLPEPEFFQEQVGSAMVRVTLRNNISSRKVFVDTGAAKILGEKIVKSLHGNENQIVNYVAEFERITVSDVQRLMGLSWPRSKKLLKGLEDKGILKHVNRKHLKRDPQAYYVFKLPNDGK